MSWCLRLLFFFSSYCHPRDLHSFPTRRSSDLDQAGLTFDGQVHAADDREAVVRVIDREREHVLERPGAELLQQQQPASDRKSTRLNSSHQISSYAVFCLKKKKLAPEPATNRGS